MDLSNFGNKIKIERNRQNITLDILSERIGISRNFLWEIEAGRKAPALKTLYKISVVLNVSIDYLVGIADKKYINENIALSEYNFYLSDISEKLNSCNIRELKLISNVLDEFARYTKEY